MAGQLRSLDSQHRYRLVPVAVTGRTADPEPAGAEGERLRRAVGTHRADLSGLDLVRSRGHLERVLNDYVRHHNTARPHRGIHLDVPVPPVDMARGRTDRINRIDRVDVLGGLIHEYRQAA